MTKEVTKKEWNSWRMFAPAEKNCSVIKKDHDGKLWIWVSSGKRVTVKKF